MVGNQGDNSAEEATKAIPEATTTSQEDSGATSIEQQLTDYYYNSGSSQKASHDVPLDDAATRVLKRGDLVLIAERRGARVKTRDGGLGRIVRVVPIPPEELAADSNLKDPHPFHYDVDFVLGGRLFNVERLELRHTTADAQGLTDSRSRRKCKPSEVILQQRDTVATVTASAPSVKGKPKKQSSNKKSVVKKESTPKKIKSKTKGAKKGAIPKKGKRGTKESDSAAAAALEEGEPDSEANRASNALDLFEKHKKEFEKSVTRLERTDVFAFFLGPPLAQFDESYSDEEDSKVGIETNTLDHTQPSDKTSDNKCVSIHEQTSHQTKEKLPTFPSSPPFNWTVVRRRLERGRYFQDRVKSEMEKRRIILSDYRKWKKANDASNGDSKAVSRTPINPIKMTKKTDEITPSFSVFHPRGIDWDLFRDDVVRMCDAAISRDPQGIKGGSGTVGHAATKIKNTMEEIYERTGRRQMLEMKVSDANHRYDLVLNSTENKEAAMQGKWRTQAFPERKYERLNSSHVVVCAGLSEVDERSAINEWKTSLPDSFVGLSYTYDDMGQSEGWMKSILADEKRKFKSKQRGSKKEDEENRTAQAMASDHGVVRAQARAAINTLCIAVQDRVMTELGVLNQPELTSQYSEEIIANNSKVEASGWKNCDGMDCLSKSPERIEENLETSEHALPTSPNVSEQPVWGIDCHTRRNIILCLQTELDAEIAHEFIEKWLLPAINACPVDIAHDITCAARILIGLPPIIEPSLGSADEATLPTSQLAIMDDTGLLGSHMLLMDALVEKIKVLGPVWLKAAAHILHDAATAHGKYAFRIHPKGHGAVVLESEGLKANSLVTYYRGEAYPPWRWGEKIDAIEKTQQSLGLRPTLPDFYNMALERPRVDPRGYGLLFMDASRKAALGSSFSHSCDPSCEVRVAAVHGQLQLAMTTLRDVEQGEELTFDYNAVTESLNEYQSAICLCGHVKCRGSFLHFATADCYQQVLSRNSPIAVRFANLVKGSMKQIMSREDEQVLENHGFGTAAFGAVSFNHHQTSKTTKGPNEALDSMENVPIWLRTYVADTLRYIEYERRALPLALLKNQVTATQSEKKVVKKKRRIKPAVTEKVIESVDNNDLSNKTEKQKKKKVAKRKKITPDTCLPGDSTTVSSACDLQNEQEAVPQQAFRVGISPTKPGGKQLEANLVQNIEHLTKTDEIKSGQERSEVADNKYDIEEQKPLGSDKMPNGVHSIKSAKHLSESITCSTSDPTKYDKYEIQVQTTANVRDEKIKEIAREIKIDCSAQVAVKQSEKNTGVFLGSTQMFQKESKDTLSLAHIPEASSKDIANETHTPPDDKGNPKVQNSEMDSSFCIEKKGKSVDRQNSEKDQTISGNISLALAAKKPETSVKEKQPKKTSKVRKEKPIRGSKPEGVFFYFARKRRDSFVSVLRAQGLKDEKGLALSQAVQKVAAAAWGALSDEVKQYWKDQAIVEWENNGGREKAELEKERKRRVVEEAKVNNSINGFIQPSPIVSKVTKKLKMSQPIKLTGEPEIKNTKKSEVEKTTNPGQSIESNIDQPRKDVVGPSIARPEERKKDKSKKTKNPGRSIDANIDQQVKDAIGPSTVRSEEKDIKKSKVRKITNPDQSIESNIKKGKDAVGPNIGKNAKKRKYASGSLDKSPKGEKNPAKEPSPGTSKGGVADTESPPPAHLSFEAADNEGWNAMEQRIQQLTQALSRVGRVLDRHRESQFHHEPTPRESPIASNHLRDIIQSPVSLLSDENVIEWIWNKDDGVVRQLIRLLSNETCASPTLKDEVKAIVEKFGYLSTFISSTKAENIPKSAPLTSFEARKALKEALLEVRRCILTSLEVTEEESLIYEIEKVRLKAKFRRDAVRKQKIDLESKMDVDGEPRTALLSSVEGNVKTEPIVFPEHINVTASTEISTEMARDQGVRHDSGTSGLKESKEINNCIAPQQVRSMPIKIEGGSMNAHASLDTQNKNIIPDSARSAESSREATVATVNPEGVQSASDLSVPCHDMNITNEVSSGVKPSNPISIKTEKLTFRQPDPWIAHRRHRYKLEALADLLLMYAHTGTFFQLKPYCTFESTPIEVYARELGNAVPASTIEIAREKKATFSNVALVGNFSESKSRDQSLQSDDTKCPRNKEREVTNAETSSEVGSVNDASEASQNKKRSRRNKGSSSIESGDMCEPEQVITNVVVKYQGDFVVSQLLQWYNGGIGQKDGLPNTLGCISLPPVSGCFREKMNVKALRDSTIKFSSLSNRQTSYRADIRPLLIDWFGDRVKRGSPWPEEISDYFAPQEEHAFNVAHPFGSPILDLLVTGDDANIQLILDTLRYEMDDKKEEVTLQGSFKEKSAEDRMNSKVDEGMPAQAVATWVQCEKCLKWRKLPWHVDADLLPEKFFCENNVWNSASNNCSAPEDQWDESDATVHYSADVLQDTPQTTKKEKHTIPKVTKHNTKKKVARESQGRNSDGVSNLVVGARLDILRKANRSGEEKIYSAVIVGVDVELEVTKRVKIHFHKMASKFDEWIEVGSNRIAPHGMFSGVTGSPSKPALKTVNQKRNGSKKLEEDIISASQIVDGKIGAPVKSVMLDKSIAPSELDNGFPLQNSVSRQANLQKEKSINWTVSSTSSEAIPTVRAATSKPDASKGDVTAEKVLNKNADIQCRGQSSISVSMSSDKVLTVDGLPRSGHQQTDDINRNIPVVQDHTISSHSDHSRVNNLIQGFACKANGTSHHEQTQTELTEAIPPFKPTLTASSTIGHAGVSNKTVPTDNLNTLQK